MAAPTESGTAPQKPAELEPAVPGPVAAASAKAASDSFQGKIDELGSEFVTAQEWGIFGGAKNNPDLLCARIIDQLGKAQAAVTAKDLVAQQTSFLEAKDAFCIAQRRRPFWYLGNTRFGLLPLIYTAFSSTFAYWYVFHQFAPSTFEQTLHNAAFWGLVGGILKSLYWLQFQINKGVLRPRWLAYFLVAPVIGTILGAISCLIVKVGIKLFKSGADVQTDWKVVALFAAFAGFNWEWALAKLKNAAEAVLSPPAAKKDASTPKASP